MPQMMDGHAVQHVGGETNRPVQFCPAKFGKEHAAQHADGHAEQRGLPQQNKGSDDGVCHAAADFAHGLGQLGEERQVDGTEALDDQVIKHQHQRRDHQDGARKRQDLNDGVLEFTPVVIWYGHF